MGAVKRKGKIKKTEMDKTSLKQTGLENWAIRTQEEKKTPLGKKIDNGNTISRSAENELGPPVMAIPPLENETQEFDVFFPLSQEMK